MQDTNIWAILDFRGLVLHSYHIGVDSESFSKQIRSPEHTLSNFVDLYLLNIVDTIPLNHIIAVHDAGSEYRKLKYPEYKANREEAEPEIHDAHKQSFEAVKNMMHCLGVPQCYVDNTEADDVIAYLAQRLPGHKIIYTVDGDITALINDDVSVMLKGVAIEEYQHKGNSIEPKYVTLYKSLVGDSSDNIKGVKGFGPVTWTKLKAELGTVGLDQLISVVEAQDFSWVNIAMLGYPTLKTIAADMEGWAKSYEVAKLHPELVNKMMANKKVCHRLKWVKRLPNAGNMMALGQELNARWLYPKLEHLLPQVRQLVRAPDWDADVIDALIGLFNQSRFVSIDWETWAPPHQPFIEAANGDYVDMLSSKITGAGITCGFNHEFTYYFQFDHADTENNIPKKYLVNIIGAIPASMAVVAHNTIFERTVFKNEFGLELPNLHCTKLMAGHVDESTPNGLKGLVKSWMKYNQTEYKQVIEDGKTMRDYTGEHVFDYGADDPWVTAHLYDLFKLILMTEGSWDFISQQEFTAMYPLSDAYIAGVCTDYAEVERQRQEDDVTFHRCMAEIRQLLQENTNSMTAQEGAYNWFEELKKNKVAELNAMRATIKRLGFNRSAPFYEQVLRESSLKDLEQFVHEEVTPLDLLQHLDTIEQGTVYTVDPATGRESELWKEAMAAATYVSFTSTPTKAKFQFSLTCVNKLNAFLGLPAWDTDNFILTQVTELMKVTQGTKQKHYLAMVCDCLEADGKHTKLDAYRYLKKLYEENFEGEPTKSGTELNFNSPKQMCEFLYAMLGLPIEVRAFEVSKSRKQLGLQGAPQTDKDAINHAIANGHAVGWKKDVLLHMREAKSCLTRNGLFYSKFPLWAHPIDGLMHPTFNQIGTESRRPSGRNPNLLQLAKKGDGVKVRRAILPNKKLGHDLIFTADWAAQELRVMAALSQDENMLACYIGETLKDIHGFTAAFMLNLEYDAYISGLKGSEEALAKKYKDTRGYAKNVNFGSIYGIGKAKLARQLLMPETKAGEFLVAKKEAYPQVETWKEAIIADLKDSGFVTTQFGSRRHLFEKLYDDDQDLVAYYIRAAINFLIQGCCADYLKKVLADLHRKQIYQKYNAVLVAPIYDELVNSVHHSVAVPFIMDVYRVMVQGIPGLNIPMLAAPAVGLNFADQIEILEDENDILTEEKIEAAISLALSKGKSQ